MTLELRLALRMTILTIGAMGIVFLPAWSWRYWQGWAYLAAFILPIVVAHLYFLRYDRALLERRMRTRETVTEQKWLIRVFALLFLAAFPLPGFDHRLGWSRQWVGDVPVGFVLVSDALVAAGFVFVFWVLKVNSFAGRTITIDAGQKVISTGPYAWVRHPMYLGAVVLWSFTPIALGSWVALPAFVLLIPFYVIRLLNEEKVLRAELPGYSDYCVKTRYHLIPFLW
jgi:protein-S-isoprenylcysteine O-methyltransferase Ste14